MCLQSEGWVACKPDPTPLPMVSTHMDPQRLLFSHSSGLKHPSHPITADAQLPKRTGRAWWNWGQSEFEGTWWGPLGYGVSCRSQTFVSTLEWHLKFKALKRRSHQKVSATFSDWSSNLFKREIWSFSKWRIIHEEMLKCNIMLLNINGCSSCRTNYSQGLRLNQWPLIQTLLPGPSVSCRLVHEHMFTLTDAPCVLSSVWRWIINYQQTWTPTWIRATGKNIKKT